MVSGPEDHKGLPYYTRGDTMHGVSIMCMVVEALVVFSFLHEGLWCCVLHDVGG